MQWGKELPKLQAIADAGTRVPALESRPHAEIHLQWVLSAFNDLSTDRPVSMGGLLPIPWTSADRYAQRHGIADFERFWALLRRLDSAFLDMSATKTKPTKPRKR